MTAPALSPNPVQLTGAQRRALRALGHHLDAVLQIGQRGITDALVEAAIEALTRHELIKVSVGREAPVDRQEAPLALARLTGSHVAQVLGRTALLYRRRFDDPTVELPGVIQEGPRPPPPKVLSADPKVGPVIGKATPRKATPGKATPGKAAPRAAAPRAPGKAAPRAPGKAAPRAAAPRAPGQATPGKAAPRSAAPGQSAGKAASRNPLSGKTFSGPGAPKGGTKPGASRSPGRGRGRPGGDR